MPALPPTITAANAQSVLHTLLSQWGDGNVQKGGQERVDASGLQHFDSSALAVLLELKRRCGAAGTSFGVDHMSPHLQELAALYGVKELLQPAGTA